MLGLVLFQSNNVFEVDVECYNNRNKCRDTMNAFLLPMVWSF